MYYIYEIIGDKIGCTDDWDERQITQRRRGKMVLLETHTDIYVASRREIELQKEKGYPIDKIPYWKFVQFVRPKCEAKEVKKRRVKNTDYVARRAKHKETWNSSDKSDFIEKARKHQRVNMIRVKAVRVSDNKELGIYESMEQAARVLKVNPTAISRICNPNTIRKTTKGIAFYRV